MIWRTAPGASIGGSAMPFFSTSASLTAASLVGPLSVSAFRRGVDVAEAAAAG